ncbi:MAG: ATP synthase F1 subunit epsilon [Gemmatimonadetes bacterium]|nr:ATP synthase F1 subunit epsilon [Gemmatimonadota bacterium]|tara:strand:+ start:783 stop:1178 length:396 start_codon:yes stop_codon:yes gene_type:complete
MPFELEIVTPERRLYAGTVDRLRAPGTDGGFGVLTGHHPMVASLKTGSVTFSESGASERNASISGGFAEVLRDRVTILAETAELSEDIDRDRAEQARDRAQQRLSRRVNPDVDVVRAEAALERALNRLRLV